MEFLRKFKQLHGEKNQVNYIILILTLVIVVLGLNILLSASSFWAEQKFQNPYFFFQKQVIFALCGIVIMIMASQVNYKLWLRLAWPFYIISLLLLALVFVPGIGKKAGGAYRWLSLGPLSLQPSDLAKLAVILVLSRIYMHKEKIGAIQIIISLLVIVIPFLLIALEPDFSTALHLLLTAIILLFFTAFPLWLLLSLFALSLPILYWGVIREPYRLKRFISFLDPYKYRFDGGFQLIASYKAFMAGGFWGNGLGEGLKRHSLQARHTDFILAVTAEDIGFVGVALLLSLFMAIVIYGFYLASKIKDEFGRLLASGIILMFFLQSFINIGVTMGLLPTTGINLPLVSYGGSSLLIYLFMFGIFLNITKES